MSTHGTQPDPAKISDRPGWLGDLTAYLACLAGGVYLTWNIWQDPRGSYVANNHQDSVQMQWFITHAARLFSHGDNPFFTTQINAPRGVNLMANTAVLAMQLPLAPVTLLFGPAITVAVLLTIAPASTAAAWYHVISRHIVRWRPAAFLGAAFAGFSPAMVSHETGHPNIVTQFTVPFIVLTVLRIRVPGRTVRTGLELAALVVVQTFINEEVLFLTALALGVLVLVTLAYRRQEVLDHVRRGVRVCCVTAVAASVVLAVPLYWQFFGSAAYKGLPAFVLGYGTDASAITAYSTESLRGPSGAAAALAQQGPTEQNAFFGIGLPILLLLMVVAMRRLVLVRILAVTGAILLLLSMGSQIAVANHATGIYGPWFLLAHLPIFDSVVPTRIAMLLTPVIAVMLAVAAEQVRATNRRRPDWTRRVLALRLGWTAALVIALLPIAPTPLDTARHRSVPHFFSSDAWRTSIPRGVPVSAVPMGWEDQIDSMQWQVATNLEFTNAGGYYLAPDPHDGRRGRFGPPYLATAQLLDSVAVSGMPIEGTSAQREQCREDFRELGIGFLVLPVGYPRFAAVRSSVESLVGPGQQVDDVVLWDVRALSAG